MAALATPSGAAFIGLTEIWYAKSPLLSALILNATDVAKHVDPLQLEHTHALLGTTTLRNKDKIFREMQGEAWSPNGEAHPLIQSLGLSHTSMSVGDAVVVYHASPTSTGTRRVHVVMPSGWCKLDGGG